jgi:hypothetical protein
LAGGGTSVLSLDDHRRRYVVAMAYRSGDFAFRLQFRPHARYPVAVVLAQHRGYLSALLLAEAARG